MAAFLEDPRLRQRWNQISHNAETVTENAAAGIWTFQHTYVTPCLASMGEAVDACTSVCLGDREERARRQRERARGAHRSRAEYSFDFYDDWYDDFNDDGLEDDGLEGPSADRPEGGSSIFDRGFFGSLRRKDWDRLLAGSGSTRSRHGDVDGGGGDYDEGGGGSGGPGASNEIVDQPRRRRGMSYSTRAMRRKGPDSRDDPTVIPSTAPLGFLSRLPFKIGGTLRYKPSAANLREHPIGSSSAGGSYPNRNSLNRQGNGIGGSMMTARDEQEPLLGGGSDNEDGTGTLRHQYGGASEDQVRRPWQQHELVGAEATNGQPQFGDTNATTRNRSGTTGSGDTSDSYRSRGDLFPSDEEDDEDAVPLDDEFAVALDRVDDRSSGRTRMSSSSSLALAQGAAGAGQRKGKKRSSTAASAKGVLSRSVSRTTIGSVAAPSSSLHSSQQSPRSPAGSTPGSIKKRHSSMSLPMDGMVMEEDEGQRQVGEDAAAAAADTSFDADAEDAASIGRAADLRDEEISKVEGEEALRPPRVLSLEQLQLEEAHAAREEDAAVERKRQAAAQLARERGLASRDDAPAADKGEMMQVAVREEQTTHAPKTEDTPSEPKAASEGTSKPAISVTTTAATKQEPEFVPARLPHFG